MKISRWHETKDLLPESDRHVLAITGRGCLRLMWVEGSDTWCSNGLPVVPSRWKYVINLGAIAP